MEDGSEKFLKKSDGFDKRDGDGSGDGEGVRAGDVMNGEERE